MVIRDSPEISHPVLGPIRFDDGQPNPNVYGSTKYSPQWVARPNGWHDADFEILLECGPDAPSDTSIQRAISVLNNRNMIAQQAKSESGHDVTLAWFDCTRSQCTAALTDARDAYILWHAKLDSENNIVEMTEGQW